MKRTAHLSEQQLERAIAELARTAPAIANRIGLDSYRDLTAAQADELLEDALLGALRAHGAERQESAAA